MIIEWRKDCNCKAPGTMPGLNFKQMKMCDETEYRIEITFHPGPCCDACGKPWKKTKSL